MSKASKEPKVEQWSVYRWKQLEELGTLVNECRSLNRGSGVVERIQRITAIADRLDKLNLSKRCPGSLMSFLRAQARHGYAQRKRKPSPRPATEG